MSNFTFFKAFTLLQEAGQPLGLPGGRDLGGPPGGALGGSPGPPSMGGGPPGMGGTPGGPDDPMGGGMGQQPIEVRSVPAADVWKMLEKIVKDEKKYGKFFEEINVAKKQQSTTYSKKPEKKSSLMR